MARARNIKPGLFRNEILGIADPLYTILFEGLWVLADREGRLEDRPLRIKADIFPYRDGLSMDSMLDWLAVNGFIVRYEVSGAKYIEILNFKKHQNPHKNETESEIPAPCSGGTSFEIIGTTSEKIGSARADSLSTDSGFLIPESISAAGGDTEATAAKRSDGGKREDYPPQFEEAWSAYPQRPGMNKRQSHKAWAARVKAGVSPAVITEGVIRYARFCTATEKIGTEFVKQPSTFFGPDEHFKADWTVPAKQAHMNGVSRHGNFNKQDYHSGVAADGSF